METKKASEHPCAACPMRKRAEVNPKALLSRLWRWHTRWCPGWKSYQAALTRESA
jgi:hypothetical protein